jgi:hypothetical protein
MIQLKILHRTGHLRNEEIFNSIVKKEGGVNPFLTIMNFKITFKTWLKHANLILKDRFYQLMRQANQLNEKQIQEMEFIQKEQKETKYFYVDIE